MDPVTADPLQYLIEKVTSSLQFLGQQYLIPGIWIIAMLVIAYSGIKYITGGVKGGEEAKKSIMAAMVGLIIVAISYLLIKTIIDIVSSVPPPVNN